MNLIKEYIAETIFSIIIVLIIGLIIFLEIDDYSQLTHHALVGTLIDKWHENVCSTTYDGTNYYTDCDNQYTLVIKFPDSQLEQRVSNDNFMLFKIGGEIDYQYDIGKRGGIHNQIFNPAARSLQ
jgi:hypothetical protein